MNIEKEIESLERLLNNDLNVKETMINTATFNLLKKNRLRFKCLVIVNKDTITLINDGKSLTIKNQYKLDKKAHANYIKERI